MPALHRFLAAAVAVVFTTSVLAVVSTASASASYGTATKVSAGGSSACAITPKQRLKCWGDNSYGQLGIGDDLSDQLTPVTVPNLKNVIKVDEGDYDTCAILKGGKLKCWGYNYYGAVGNGKTKDRHVPTQVKGLTSGVKAVSVGLYHTCALMQNSRAKCWGENTYGEVGNGTSGNEVDSPKLVELSDVSQISAGYDYTCAKTHGKAKCWGYNSDGQLGDKSTDPAPNPTQVFGLTKNVKKVIAGYSDTCAVLNSGKLKCWGDNDYGQVGDGTTGTDRLKPTQVSGMTSGVTSVDADYEFTCAVQSGRAKCWGNNTSYQLGDGTTDEKNAPHQVKGLTKNVKAVDISFYTGCALLKSGAAKCWGRNGEGEVGINSTDGTVPTPKRVHL